MVQCLGAIVGGSYSVTPATPALHGQKRPLPHCFLKSRVPWMHTAQRLGQAGLAVQAEQEGQESPLLPVPSLSEVPAELQYLTKPPVHGS